MAEQIKKMFQQYVAYKIFTLTLKTHIDWKWRDWEDICWVATDTAEIQGIIRYCYEQLFTNKLDNLEDIQKFLETYNFPRPSQEKIENQNRTITSKIESVIRISQQRKAWDQVASLMNFTKLSKKN